MKERKPAPETPEEFSTSQQAGLELSQKQIDAYNKKRLKFDVWGRRDATPAEVERALKDIPLHKDVDRTRRKRARKGR